LSAQIEGQLRAAYDQKFKAKECTQASLAKKLGVNRSAVHHRLMGHTNMTVETIADMVWALDHAIRIEIFDPLNDHSSNHFMCGNSLVPQPLAQAQSEAPAARMKELLMQGMGVS
jgi:hypothetical protein